MPLSLAALRDVREPMIPGAGWDPLLARVVHGSPTIERHQGRFVLYWMQAQRRMDDNPALALAVERANAMRLPLVVYEGLRVDHPGANDRTHTFILEGARENAVTARRLGIRYVLYVPRSKTETVKAVVLLSRHAALLITDEHPAFIYPGQTVALMHQAGCPVVTVDGCGVVPMSAIPGPQPGARSFRPRIQRLLPTWLPVESTTSGPKVKATDLPLDAPWETDPMIPAQELVKRSDVDHTVHPSPLYTGGRTAGLERLAKFLEHGLHGYASGRNIRAARGTSELSPYLHFGMISPGEVVRAVLRTRAANEDVDAFCEQVVVRRELAFNFCRYSTHHRDFHDLPKWARATMVKHARDRRECIPPEELEAAHSGDPVWDAAQTELRLGGRIHNYLRMLWGKRALAWFPTYEQAHAWLLDQHERYALDGRDPCTYANVLWLFGLHDRAWGPERPIHGKLRYMTSQQTMKKVDWKAYQEFVNSLR